ncbi:MAG: sugar transferase [Sphingobacteriales bacterium]|nr:MAG: sugar transferase [Sphingobacteriales bacterium]
MYKSFGKRVLDIFLGVTGFILLLPIFFLIAIILSISNKGSAFFFQERPGKNKKLFKVVKFKTMNDRKDASGNLLPDVDRLTRIGKFVRKTSMDELPQLFNVLLGDMSFVGPRPLLVDYLPLYSERQQLRHAVKPGITGWAQINGRNTISWKEKFELDVWYVEHQSFWLDSKIVIKTFLDIFQAKDISHPGSATMPKFTGD